MKKNEVNDWSDLSAYIPNKKVVKSKLCISIMIEGDEVDRFLKCKKMLGVGKNSQLLKAVLLKHLDDMKI